MRWLKYVFFAVLLMGCTKSYTPCSIEPKWNELNGNWKAAPNPFTSKEIKLQLSNGVAILTNFPSLLQFERRSGIIKPQIEFLDGQKQITLEMMPRGWGLDINGNKLRIGTHRGKTYLIQYASVYSDARIVYTKSAQK